MNRTSFLAKALPLSHRLHTGCRLLVAALLVASMSLPLGAATVYWVADGGNYDGDFQDTNHWSLSPGGPGGAAVPTSSDTAVFDNGQPGAYEVDLNASLSVGGFQVHNDQVMLDVSTHSLNYGSGSFIVGGAGQTGVLTLTSSAVSGQGIVVGVGAVHVGVGDNANGTLIIDNGARFERTGTGTPVFGSGNGAESNIHIINGIGNFSGSSMVWGSGGAVSNITIEANGTMITNGTAVFSHLGAPTVNLTMNGGTWNHTHGSRAVAFGSENSGQGAAQVFFNLNSGATATNNFNYEYDDGRPERSFGKDVNVLVTDPGTTMRSDGHYIGGGNVNPVESSHRVTVADNAIIGVSNLMRVWDAADSNNNGVFGDPGLLTLDNGIIELHGTVGAAASLDVRGVMRGSGAVRRRAGTGTDLVSMTVGANGLLHVGDITNTPGIGQLTLENGTLDIAGTLALDIASLSNFDKIEAMGAGSAIDLAGMLEVVFLDGYAPNDFDVFNLLVADTISYSAMSNLDFDPKRYSLTVLQDYFGSQDVLQLQILPIPEPSTLGLTGCAALLMLRRRRGARGANAAA